MNLWELYGKGWYLGITTCTTLGVWKRLVMGGGIAKQALQRFRAIGTDWGKQLPLDQVYVDESRKLVRIPTKYHWRDDSYLDLIVRSIRQLDNLLPLSDRLVVPPLGCGLGRLRWIEDVKPLFDELKPRNVFVADHTGILWPILHQ